MKRLFLLLLCCMMVTLAIHADEVKKDVSSISNGIKVHGHWRLEVLDTEGNSINVTEFDNAIRNHSVFTFILSGTTNYFRSSGGWLIELGGASQDPCGTQPCIVAESGIHPASLGFTYDSTNLQVSVTGSSSETIHLSGSVVATQDASIDEVQTDLKLCTDTVAPADCPAESTNASWAPPTRTFLASPVSVLAGQTVMVTVDITFS